jgi:hypothetical protein
MLKCQKCNYENELGRIFCHQCGTKLDLDKIKPGSHSAPKIKRKGALTTARVVSRVVNLAIVAVVIWAIYLMVQIPHIELSAPTNQDLISLDNKRLQLEDLQNEAAPVTIEFTEKDLNTFLSSLSFEKPRGNGVEMIPRTVDVKLRHGVATADFVGTIKFGSLQKNVFLSYSGVPKIENGEFVFEAVGGAIGELPIHPRLVETSGLFDRYFGELFSKLHHEKTLLDKLSSIRVDDGRVLLQYEPPARTTSR